MLLGCLQLFAGLLTMLLPAHRDGKETAAQGGGGEKNNQTKIRS